MNRSIAISARRMRQAFAASATMLLCCPWALAQEVNPTFSYGTAFQQVSGASIYRAVCQGCHMPQGQGAQGAGSYPALAANPKLAGADYPIYVVLRGYKGMPAFGSMLSDEQVAAVVDYARSSFGNQYRDPTSSERVRKARPQ